MMRHNNVEKQVRPKTMPAGIYHNATLGLISLSSDGDNWITIADKNLGATNVYSSGTPDDNNGGLFYQWGNCYGFAFSGNLSGNPSQINTSSYGPNNYYSSSTWIYGNYDRSNPSNNNLWGDTTDTKVARKGPCATGYHIASATEWNEVLTIGIGWSLTTGAWLINYLRLPPSGFRNNGKRTGLREHNGNIGFYWSSSPGNSNTYGGFLQFSSSQIDNNLTSGWYKTLGANIRPFKDEAVQPDDTRTILYQPS